MTPKAAAARLAVRFGDARLASRFRDSKMASTSASFCDCGDKPAEVIALVKVCASADGVCSLSNADPKSRVLTAVALPAAHMLFMI